MGMGVSAGSDPKRPAPAMNVTPLVDVTLVVLIIFMVITPLTTKTFWINLPPPEDDKQEEKQPPPENDPPMLVIDQAGSIMFNGVKLSKSEIPTRLPGLLATKKRQGFQVLYFDAADEVEYSTAMEVLDLARQGGARSIALLTKKVVE